MAKKIKFKTKSPTGNLILGILFLLIGTGMLLMPCVGIAGMLVGKMTLPNNSQEILGTLFALAVLTVMAFACIAIAVLSLNATILPKTLHVTDEALLLFWVKRQVGQIPFTNIKEVIVKTRAMAGQTANSAYLQGFLAGGLIGGAIASSRFNPDESVGFIIRLTAADDPQTYWPTNVIKSILTTGNKKKLEVHYYWELSHAGMVQKINAALNRHKQARLPEQ